MIGDGPVVFYRSFFVALADRRQETVLLGHQARCVTALWGVRARTSGQEEPAARLPRGRAPARAGGGRSSRRADCGEPNGPALPANRAHRRQWLLAWDRRASRLVAGVESLQLLPPLVRLVLLPPCQCPIRSRSAMTGRWSDFTSRPTQQCRQCQPGSARMWSIRMPYQRVNLE